MLISYNDPKNPFKHGLKEIQGFQKLNRYKGDIITTLIENEDLLKLLKYNTMNPLEEKNINLDTEDVEYKYIFPFSKNPDFSGETKSFICVYYYRSDKKGNDFKNINLFIDILVDESAIRTSFGTKDILISHYIDTILNSSRGLGIGQLESKDWVLINNNNLMGYRLIYKITDFK